MNVKLYDRKAPPPKKHHRYHAEQQKMVSTEERFVACCAGRRSGKSVIARHRKMARALNAHITHPHITRYKLVIGAPTRDQVKRLHWDQVLELLGPRVRAASDISVGELRIGLPNGATAWFVGFDVPQRAEGEAIHDALLDEIADMKEEAWKLSVRPSLGTEGEEGNCTFIGKPRGRNHWWRIWTEAAEKKGWLQLHWNAEDILAAEEIASLKADLDPISYDQEVRANFVNFSGRIYYCFVRDVQAQHRVFYEPGKPLDFTFDFNVEPGIAGVSQEQYAEHPMFWEPIWLEGDTLTPYLKGHYTALIGEVWKEQNSNTRLICKQLIADWSGKHTGVVNVYGDASGGARKTSALTGSDWDIIYRELGKVANWKVVKRVPAANPPERDRVNSVNARFMASDGKVRCLIDPINAPHHVDDFDGVVGKPDGSGDIDKKNKLLTHPSDGFGYKIHKKFPLKLNVLKGWQV